MKISFPVRIFLIALVLRIIPILLTRGLGIGLDDMFQYDMLARSLASGGGYRWYALADLERLRPYINFDPATVKGYDPLHGLYTSFRAPLYPTFLAVIYFFSGTGFSRFIAARVMQAVLLGAPLAPLTYFIAKHLSFSNSEEADDGGEKIARTAAWVVACYPMLLVYPLGLGTENPFFVLLLLSFIFLLKSIERPTTFHFVISGMFLALTALTRSVILPFVGLVILYLIYLHGKRALLIGVVFILMITPWVIRNSLLHKKLTGIETSMGYNMYLGYHPQGDGSFVFGPSVDLLTITDDAERDDVGIARAFQFIKAQPARFLPLAVNRLGFFFGLEKRTLMYYYGNNIIGYISNPLLPILGVTLFLPFVVVSVSASLGLSLLRWNSKIALLLLLFISYLLPHVLILSEDRFHLAFIPFLAILAAGFWTCGFQSIAARWRESNTGKWMVALGVLGVCLLFLNWGFELSRDADKIAVLLGPLGNLTYPPY